MQALFDKQEDPSTEDTALSKKNDAIRTPNSSGRGSLPTYYADEGGQWGTRVPMPPSRQLGSDAKLGCFLPCKASGVD